MKIINRNSGEVKLMKNLITFAGNVLDYGRDKSGVSPLFADGIDITTGEQARWQFKDSSRIMSNLANQQNLFRFLYSLSAVTGEAKYRDAAADALNYHFDNLMDDSGLFRWGGHTFLDLETLETIGPEDKNMVHELKNALPFYDFMYELNPQATTKYIRAFWNAHIYDWDGLEMGRHGKYGLEAGKLWEHERVNLPVFRESSGLSFINAGNDLIYAAFLCYAHTGDQSAYDWGRHMAHQYVRARNPETGLGAYQFTQSKKTAEPPSDDATYSWFGDRAKRQFGPEFGDIALEGNLLTERNASSIYSRAPLVQMHIWERLKDKPQELLDRTADGLLSFAEYAYIPETNKIRPMFTDGTDLTGFALRRNGYFGNGPISRPGKSGDVFVHYDAGLEFFLAYVRAYILSGRKELRDTAAAMAKACGLGDLESDFNMGTPCSHVQAVFALAELYAHTGRKQYLELCGAVCANIEAKYFNGGYYNNGEQYRYAKFDCQYPLALLAYHAAATGKYEQAPAYLNGSGFIHGNYYLADGTALNVKDNDYLYKILRGGF
jgi:pectate lyase